MGVVGEEEDCVRPFFWVPDLGPPFTELLLLSCSCIRRGLRPAAGTWPLTGVAASVDAELLEGLTALPTLSASCRQTNLSYNQSFWSCLLVGKNSMGTIV